MKNAVKGNCAGVADSVLVSLHDSLGEKAKAAAQLKGAVEAKLNKKLQGIGFSGAESDDLGDHGYQKAGAHSMVVYYLAGYVHKKVTKNISCEECHTVLTAAPEQLSSLHSDLPQRHLTDLRSYKPGCLREPSLRLYTVVKKMEKTVSQTLNKSPVFGDLFRKLLDELEKASLPALGCVEHCQEVSTMVIKFYVVMRMHFFSRKKNGEMMVTQKVQQARKQAKLL